MGCCETGKGKTREVIPLANAVMKPLTSNELVALDTLLASEALLVRKYLDAAQNVQDLTLQPFCRDMAERHRRNFDLLLLSLQQHGGVTPVLTS